MTFLPVGNDSDITLDRVTQFQFCKLRWKAEVLLDRNGFFIKILKEKVFAHNSEVSK